MTKTKIIALNLIALILFGADRIFKNYLRLHPNTIWQVSQGFLRDFFDIRFWQNHNAAFSLPLGSLSGQIFPWLVAVIIMVIVAYLIEAYRDKNLSLILFLILIIAGAYSNLLDRIFYGGVIDYLNFNFWPVFNLADVMITVGVVGWATHLLFSKK